MAGHSNKVEPLMYFGVIYVTIAKVRRNELMDVYICVCVCVCAGFFCICVHVCVRMCAPARVNATEGSKVTVNVCLCT